MRKEILDILNTYSDLKRHPHQPTIQNDAKLITVDLPTSIVEKLKLDEESYKVQGSVGVGKWTDTPWISVFNRKITETAQKGFYIVFLFRKDMQGVYLSLNQGTTYIDKKYKNNKPREKMSKIASNIRENLVYNSTTFPLKQIDLVANTDNAKNYMAAHICGRYYSSTAIPSDTELLNDLNEMIKLYSQLEVLTIGRTTEETLDFYLQMEEIEDTQFQTDILLAIGSNTTKEPQLIPSKTNKNAKETWKRNPNIAKEALQINDYLCEMDNSHITFTSNITNKNFVEAHHLVPIKMQNEFSWSLDVPGNIVSLCPNCHRKIHHANKLEKKQLIRSLYNKKLDELSLYGISITLAELYDSYGC